MILLHKSDWNWNSLRLRIIIASLILRRLCLSRWLCPWHYGNWLRSSCLWHLPLWRVLLTSERCEVLGLFHWLLLSINWLLDGSLLGYGLLLTGSLLLLESSILLLLNLSSLTSSSSSSTSTSSSSTSSSSATASLLSFLSSASSSSSSSSSAAASLPRFLATPCYLGSLTTSASSTLPSPLSSQFTLIFPVFPSHLFLRCDLFLLLLLFSFLSSSGGGSGLLFL